MYYYLLHQDLQSPKYSKFLIELETKLHKLGLEGQTTKLGRYSNLEERIKEIDFSGQDTLVVVGDDEHLLKVVNLMAKEKNKPVFGYIPIGEETNLTRNFGLPSQENAIMVLAQRKIQNLDLGSCNNVFFIDSIKIQVPNIALRIGNKYNISIPPEIKVIKILNLPDLGLKNRKLFSSYQDGVLEVVLIKEDKNIFNKIQTKIHSNFTANIIKITAFHDQVEADIDGIIKLKTPLSIGVHKAALKVIVGKNRVK